MGVLTRPWAAPVRLHELAQGPLEVRLEPDAGERAKAALDLGLESLPALTAQLSVRAWLDGAEVSGRFEAVVEQLCSLSLEPFEQPLAGEIQVRLAPAGPDAPPEPEAVERDPAAPDPPDVLQGEAIDLAAIVTEHLALEIDPFARKPGARFDYSPPAEATSPFAVLKELKDREP
jgi:uncharacterized metal-binding protein YceD (DUF177 family)